MYNCRMIDCIPHLHFMLLHMHLLYFRYVNILPTIIVIMKKDIIVYVDISCIHPGTISYQFDLIVYVDIIF